jgi:hypothetical protein
MRDPGRVQPPSSRPERLTALTRALARSWRRESLAGDVAGVVAFFAAARAGLLERAPYGPPGGVLAGALVFAAVAVAVKATLLRGDSRAANEAFSWIGRWEWLRARREVADRFPASPRTIRAFVDSHEAVPHPAWVELLVFSGEADRAAELAEQLPERTPWERFEREIVLAYLRWAQSGRNDDSAARRALVEVRDPEERLRGEAQIALGEARDALGRGRDDWMAPLVRLRERLGQRADGVLRHEWWRSRALASATYGMALSVGVNVVLTLT